MIRFTLCQYSAKPPRCTASENAAFDLFSTEWIDLPPMGRTVIDTGVKVVFPEGTYGQIHSHTGLFSYGVAVLGTVLDTDYRETIKITLINFSPKTYTILREDPIAQLTVHPIVISSVHTTFYSKYVTFPGESTDPVLPETQ